MNDKINDWNKENKPWKIVDGRFGTIKTILSIVCIFIWLCFLGLFMIRTYFYDYYRDVIQVSPICEPHFNLTVGKQCGDVEIDCECIDENELEDILDDLCPDTINVYVDSS